MSGEEPDGAMTTPELVPGVRHVALGPAWTLNAYLVGGVLVDSGPRISRRLLLRGLRGATVTAHLLTHAHGDHAGSSAMLSTALGLPVWVGAADREALESGRLAGHGNRAAAALLGVLAPAAACRVDRALAEGDVVEGFEVLSVPGHTPGSVALWRAADRVLVCGDAAWNVTLPRGRPHPVPAALSVDGAAAQDSWRRLAALRPRVVLFGHGRPASMR
jgi:glyoxylase-like metal-dependent hydrolase (beta-lactamase superfamily II)